MQENACRKDENVYEFDYDDNNFFTSMVSVADGRTNQKVYGSKRPPVLPVENIHVPVKVYYSEGDTLITPSVGLRNSVIYSRRFTCGNSVMR